MPFSAEYVRLVLAENFADAKRLFLDPLMAIHRAHLTMLAGTGLIPIEDARRLRDGLDRIDLDAVRCADFDPACEDLFFYVDRLLAGACGRQAAARLHTARSRNVVSVWSR